MSATPITSNLLAVNVPAPIVPSTYNDLAAAAGGTSASSIAQALLDGDIYGMCPKITLNAAIQDAASRYGGGGVYGINNGLALSGTTTAYTLTVAQGQASIDGPVQVPAAGVTYTLPGSQSHIYVWLKQDGTVTHSLTTAVPTGGKVYLGHCVTDGSGITAIDMAGVVQLHSGVPFRLSGDSGGPTDSPSSRLTILTKTAFGTYLWNGTAHLQVGLPSVTADPSNPIAGESWWRSDTLKHSIYTGGAVKRSAAYT